MLGYDVREGKTMREREERAYIQVLLEGDL
jgi:hypothetical protein